MWSTSRGDAVWPGSSGGASSREPIAVGESVALGGGGAGNGTGAGAGRLWSEDVVATAAEVLQTYASGPLAGRPAVTRTATGVPSAR